MTKIEKIAKQVTKFLESCGWIVRSIEVKELCKDRYTTYDVNFKITTKNSLETLYGETGVVRRGYFIWESNGNIKSRLPRLKNFT